MDELPNIRFASPQLPLMERDLMREADLVFTGGQSLYNAKRTLHAHVHCFPSSVDRAHFGTARQKDIRQPQDQEPITHPRLGFYGVIDERMDFELLAVLAASRPEWQIILVGPIAKVSPDELPKQANIHYLGPKSYEDLPRYLAGWEAALMPFAINEATRFISPTKTPEYLAGGKPVVSTPITDVVREFGKLAGVKIAQTSSAFVECCEAALALDEQDPGWLLQADTLLETTSWDRTFQRMNALIEAAIQKRQVARETASYSHRSEPSLEHELRTEP
jgi:UDP-galactopyranose mutase